MQCNAFPVQGHAFPLSTMVFLSRVMLFLGNPKPKHALPTANRISRREPLFPFALTVLALRKGRNSQCNTMFSLQVHPCSPCAKQCLPLGECAFPMQTHTSSVHSRALYPHHRPLCKFLQHLFCMESYSATFTAPSHSAQTVACRPGLIAGSLISKGQL